MNTWKKPTMEKNHGEKYPGSKTQDKNNPRSADAEDDNTRNSWKHTGSADVSSAKQPITDKHKDWHFRGYLPHFDACNVYQFVTFRLHDSVPASAIDNWKHDLQWREGLSADSKEAVQLYHRIEKFADLGKGGCYLKDERIAGLVQDALKHFDGERYHLIAWCIMPNHVHVLIEVLNETLPHIIKSWKSFTAHQANKLLGRSGPFWGLNYYDRYIRDEKHFEAVIDYIVQNPVNAGLVASIEEWRWVGYIESAGDGNVSIAK